MRQIRSLRVSRRDIQGRVAIGSWVTVRSASVRGMVVDFDQREAVLEFEADPATCQHQWMPLIEMSRGLIGEICAVCGARRDRQ